MKALALAVAVLATLPAAATASSARIKPSHALPFDTVVYRAGAGEANHPSTRLRGHRLFVSDSVPIRPGKRCSATAEATRIVCRVRTLHATRWSLGDGDDRFDDALPDVEVVVHGGLGDDLIETRTGDYGLLSGGDGDDDIRAGRLDPGPMVGGAGADRMQGGTVSYAGRSAGVSVTEDGIANDGAPGEGDNVVGVHEINGGEGGDTLSGTDGRDALDGGGGDDDLEGRAGPDALVGGGGADTLAGGAGNDTLSGYTFLNLDDAGADGPGTLDGGPGADTVRGGPADDTIDAGPGEDVVEGWEGSNVVHTRDGSADLITCARFESAGSAELDDRDLAQACTSVDRAGVAAPRFVLVGQSDVERPGIVHVSVGCSQDQTAGCDGTLRIRRPGGSLLVRRHMKVTPGRAVLARPRLRLPRVFRGSGCHTVRVAISYATHDAHGRPRTLATHLRVGSMRSACHTPTLYDPWTAGWPVIEDSLSTPRLLPGA